MEVGQHIWYQPWDQLWKKYGVVLQVDEKFILLRLVDGQEIWANDFELSEGVVEE